MKEILDLKGLSAYVRVSPHTLYRMAARGKLPGVKVGRRWRFLKASIDAWLASSHPPREAKSAARPRQVPGRGLADLLGLVEVISGKWKGPGAVEEIREQRGRGDDAPRRR